MDDEFECEPESLPSRRFMKIDLAVTGLCLLYQMSQAVTNALESLTDLAGMHANYHVDQRTFADEARRQIETLIEEE